MGLDTTHNAWHGSYSSFHTWRTEIASAIGVNLNSMEGFECPGFDPMPSARWADLKHDPLHVLLKHNGAEGFLTPEECKDIARRLREVLPALSEDAAERARQFVAGCDAAVGANEPIGFH